jgi:hypothetical protein
VAARPPELGDPDAFELQLRKLDGVIAVGFGGSPEERVVHVTVNDPGTADAVRADADELARLYLGAPVWILVATPDDAEAPAPRRPSGRRPRLDLDEELRVDVVTAGPGLHRVELAGVRRQDGRTVEVVLAYGDRRSGAFAEATAAGAASATIHALRDLGFRAPFDVTAAIRLGVGITGAVAVFLRGTDGERLGMARSPATEEAAAKATLHALNRYLDDPRRQIL